MGEHRNSSFFKQWKMLALRGQQYAYRNPFSLTALLGMSLFASLIISSIFNGVGAERLIINPLDPFNADNLAHNAKV